jgi:hypothetical protein
VDLRLALDQNFPAPIVRALQSYIPGVQLTPVGDIDARLPIADDWQLLLALSQKGYDGLVTQDARMLNLAKELIVIEQTRLKVIVIEATGHQPVAATGILLAHLDGLRAQADPRRAQVWRLRVKLGQPDAPGDLLNRVAAHSNTSPAFLRRDHAPSTAEMSGDPLAHIDPRRGS